jgi:hypothetical protein
MTISVRSSSKNSADSGTAITVAAPAGTDTGDVVVVVIHGNGETSFVDNNGATPFTENLADYTTGGTTISVFSRRIQAGDPATYAFTLGASNRWSIVAVALQNPHDTDVYDIAPAEGNTYVGSGAGTMVDFLSITTLTDNAIHLVACCVDSGTAGVSATPAGYTHLQTTTAGQQVVSVCYKSIAATGATGTGTFTLDTDSVDRITLSFAIKSSTGGGGTTYYSTLDGTL